jgi:hypothetical protein
MLLPYSCLQPAFTANDNCTAATDVVCPAKYTAVVPEAAELVGVAKSDIAGQQAVCCEPLKVSALSGDSLTMLVLWHVQLVGLLCDCDNNFGHHDIGCTI